eukprot:scaffold56.g4540.t1
MVYRPADQSDSTITLKAIDFGKSKIGNDVKPGDKLTDIKYLFHKQATSALETFKRNNWRDAQSPEQMKHYPLHKLMAQCEGGALASTKYDETIGKIGDTLIASLQEAENIQNPEQKAIAIDYAFDTAMLDLAAVTERLIMPPQIDNLANYIQCLPIPQGWSDIEAAGLPETYFTVWSNVFDRGRLSVGEALLVHGGASGIGTTAIQLARAFGHAIYATVGSDERVHAVEALGASRGINYRTQDYVKNVLEATAGRGVDVILDMVAGDYIARDLQCLADDGRVVIIALLGGAQAKLDCNQILRRRLTITGSTLRSQPVAFKAAIARALRAKVWPLLEQGVIKPVVHASFPLRQAAAAHALMEAGEHVGKIVLTV